MRDGAPQTIYRKDYRAPAFSIPEVTLNFSIYEGYTLVESELHLRRCDDGGKEPLVLNGEGLTVESLTLDGTELTEADYTYIDGLLTIPRVGNVGLLCTRVRIAPEENTSLEGLYRSRTMYATQCEAEGFRKITFFPDRPDVLSTFTVSVEADKQRCPVLLSNGNQVLKEDLEDGRHRVVWHDPWPKPCYLFALVAGDLAQVSDTFVTQSGRVVDLHIFVEAKDINYCGHAMDSLKRSMRWDEEVYGLEYDLDLFNIVAVDDFNMGAMENKSLNIFNTSCVLAAPDITTDAGYQRIEAIVAHEYFHNYSGNRVTCRDWFQLSLKEGFTVFRDSEFSADMNSRGVKRVEDVSFLRTHQFAEDAGPMAHPVRPDSFIEISNFYTLTVYEKGAEVVRMLHTLLGHEQFIDGARLYFQRHDGQAATCDDFVNAMEEASGRDLSQFRNWYEQPGTPVISVDEIYDENNQRFILTLRQENPGAPNNPPLHIPVAVGLLVDDEPVVMESGSTTRLLELTEAEQTFAFEQVVKAPVASILRGFSAPVRLRAREDERALQSLIAGDDDDFVRWDAFQRYASQIIDDIAAGNSPHDGFFTAFASALAANTDPAMKAHLLTLPSEEYLADVAASRGLVDVFAIRSAREHLKALLANRFETQWRSLYLAMANHEAYCAEGAQIGRRALRHLALDYLSHATETDTGAAEQLFESADNLTDRLMGLRLLVNQEDPRLRERALNKMLADWQHEALVVNQWFSVQAMRPSADTVEAVLALQDHPAFDWRNPNKIRALVGVFANANPVSFHRQDGAGYRLLADAIIRMQAANPQIAARLCTPLTRFKRYAHGVDLMRAELERIASVDGLSRDVFEVVDRSLRG